MLYSCISIGQLARKNRVLAAVGVYFGYYVLTQILSTMFTILVSLFGEDLFELIGQCFANHPIPSVHTLLCQMVILPAIMAGIWFLITHTIIRKRLNLE